MNRVTTGDLQSITIEVGNELILEDPDFRAEAIREDRIRYFVHQKLVEETNTDWAYVDVHTTFARAKYITHRFEGSQGERAETTVNFVPYS